MPCSRGERGELGVGDAGSAGDAGSVPLSSFFVAVLARFFAARFFATFFFFGSSGQN